MKLRTVGYFIKQASLSLFRNMWMSLAAMGSVTVSMFILGAFLLLALNINYIATSVQSNVQVAVFFQVDTPRQEVINTQKKIEAMSQVTEVKLVPKEEGLKQISQQFGGEQELLEATGGINPLPDYLLVKVDNPETIEDVAITVGTLPWVEKVNYGQEIIDKLFAVARWLRWLGAGIILLLGFGALFLIMITIRLTVFSRQREINIMKYVGATDWFIRWPFILEGLMLGLIGSSIAALMVYFGYNMILNKIGTAVTFVPLIFDEVLILRCALTLVAGGALVGALGSILSIRRFLRV